MCGGGKALCYLTLAPELVWEMFWKGQKASPLTPDIEYLLDMHNIVKSSGYVEDAMTTSML